VNIVARIMGGHPVGGPQPVPEPEGQLWTEALKDTSGDSKSSSWNTRRTFSTA
jgi:hypothetical protein